MHGQSECPFCSKAIRSPYERIADQGPDFHSEVRRFKALNAEYIAKYGLPSW